MSSWINPILRDMCFEAAKQGLAFDVGWSSELSGRDVCMIPSARSATRQSWHGKFTDAPSPRAKAARVPRPVAKDADPTPAVKDPEMTDETAATLLAFLAQRLEPSDLDRAKAILAGMDDGAAEAAQDRLPLSLQRRVRQAQARSTTAAPGYEQLFPNAARLG